MPDHVIIGVNILEILTTGMYRDSRVIYREYIQNSCDQIDTAVKSGLLAENEGQVDLWIDDAKRSVCVEDNSTGISASIFREKLYSIGESSKTLGEDKGFRGIGHWCGLGYCKTLIFTAKAKDENVESVMTCNAEKMRRMMDEHNSHEAHYTVDEVLTETIKFSQNKTKETKKHYFKVELLEIRDVHTELCSLRQVKDYLSFVAPVGYATAFRFRNTIHNHAKSIGQPIREYNVFVNGERIMKKYTPSFTTSKGEDCITDVDFKEFKDENGSLIAWLWFGISRFQGVIKKDNQMRGIRLRTQNIQIGSEDSLQKLFKEDRGQNYFIGEVFAIATDLIPNSQRDYFNENKARLKFEHLLSDFFNHDLSRIYKAGSNINSKYDKIEKVKLMEDEISTVVALGRRVSDEQIAKLERAKNEAHNAAQELAKIREKTITKLNNNASDKVESVINEILKANDERRTRQTKQNALSKEASTHSQASRKSVSKLITDKNSSVTYKKNEILVFMNSIYEIIRQIADASTAQAIITRIEEELL